MKTTTFKVKVFVDTNVLIDYLIPSRHHHEQALLLFGLILSAEIEAGMSTQSLLDAAYILRKAPHYSPDAFRQTMHHLLDRINVDSISSFDFRDALQDSEDDLEDNAQIAFAYSQCCDVLVTYDKKLLSREVPRPMTVMTTEEFVNHCRA